MTNPYPLWSGDALPSSAEIPLLDGVAFSVIQPYQPEVDGGNWVLGAALAWHRNRLYASYGFNCDAHENTATEQAHCRISDDDGRTWGEAVVIDNPEDNLAVSHGVFLSRGDELWAFHGAFYDNFRRTHTRAYRLDDETGAWLPQGVVVADGFWPLQEPLKMANGNWLMTGVRVSNGYPGVEGDLPAVAISHGEDVTTWDLVVIPAQSGLGRIWGESTVFIAGNRIFNISRWGGQAKALVSVSDDHGRSWTAAAPSNLNMNTSKPYTGTLSTGEHYLIGATTADCVHQRHVLTIALTRAGETAFSRVFVIRHGVFPQGPGPSSPDALLSYPYAIERGGKLYVGYADKKEPTVELAVVPLSALAATEPRISGDGTPE